MDAIQQERANRARATAKPRAGARQIALAGTRTTSRAIASAMAKG